MDVIPDGEGVEEHQYHGMCYSMCGFKEVRPRKRHNLCQQGQQRGELRVVTRGCINDENGSYVTVRLRNSINNKYCNEMQYKHMIDSVEVSLSRQPSVHYISVCLEEE